MGKVFITDEVNDNYTADVTNAGKVCVETAAAKFKILSSAASTVNTSGQVVSNTNCYLKSIIIGQIPGTATQLSLYDTTTSADNLSAFGSSGSNIIARLQLDVSGGASSAPSTYPRVIPFNVYCASGIMAAIGEGQSYAALSGCAKNITITYQT